MVESSTYKVREIAGAVYYWDVDAQKLIVWLHYLQVVALRVIEILSVVPIFPSHTQATGRPCGPRVSASVAFRIVISSVSVAVNHVHAPVRCHATSVMFTRPLRMRKSTVA